MRAPAQSPHTLLSALITTLVEVAALIDLVAQLHPTRAVAYRAHADAVRRAAQLLKDETTARYRP